MSIWNQPYWVYLGVISLAFLALERIRPWRKQKTLREGFDTDLLYLAFNGYVLALLLAPAAALITPRIEAFIVPSLGRAHIAEWPLWAQGLVVFFIVDLMKWSIHVTLHRVGFLWKIHRVHHSIVDMDWIGNMRFHWLEIVIYDGALYLPLLLLGMDWRVLFVSALFSTVMGHFNHSNLQVSLGPLKYLLNHPGMHIWHHDYDLRYSAGCNFGINLSLWDWIFRTAYLPIEEDQPKRLGFRGIERFESGFVAQQLFPLSILFSGSGKARK